ACQHIRTNAFRRTSAAYYCFFFQAEDGIRDSSVTGVQTCALPIFLTRPVDRTELLARVRSLLKLKQRTDELERAESVLFSLARSIEGKDPYTHGHCERLAEYSATL